MASIEDRLVELINSASSEVDSSKKLEYWCQMKALAQNHGLLFNFFQDILTPGIVICFNLEGTRLICGGGYNHKSLELWTIDASDHWNLIWNCPVTKPIRFLRYSPDSTLFCSAGDSDPLVKVWYEARTTRSYGFIYLKHPKPLTSLEWRRTGRFTPRGAVANVLMTSCEDNRVRLWVQTCLPDLVNFKLMPHFHLAAVIEDNPTIPIAAHWINNKELHITRSLENLLQDMLARILKENEQTSSSATTTTNDFDLDVVDDDTLTAESSKKLRHKLCRKINKQRALAASGRISTTVSKTSEPGDADNSSGTPQDQPANNGPTSLADEFDRTLETLLREWRGTTDLLFSIDKSSGTLTSWQIRYLDGEESGGLRQVQVDKFTCLKSALPYHHAITISNITTYSPSVGTDTFIVTQHVCGTLCLWKLNLEQGLEMVTRITGLPISPEWLCDGILSVEFDQVQSILNAAWLQELHKPDANNKDFYKASELSTNLKNLPQYHVTQLVELLAFGKLQRVKAILNHLVNCLAPNDKRAHRSRTYSFANRSLQESLDIEDPNSPLTSVEEVELDYVEVTSIKPLALHLLLKADVETVHSGKLHHAHEEFSSAFESIAYTRSSVDDTLDEILGKSTLETLNKQKDQEPDTLISFNSEKSKVLTHILTHTHIPGLTNTDQMHLLAVADAVATNVAIDSLDDPGLRYLTALRQYVYLTKCLPIKQRGELKQQGIGNDNIIWAFHSETHDELISMIPCIQRNKPEWSELKEFGVGWWLKKSESLKKIIEKVAQSAYQAEHNPLDAALFYLAMKKKSLVCALMRRTPCVTQPGTNAQQGKLILKLFEQDFTDPVNRKKALKNAYALLGKHRFEHAATFFLLAGSIWDAVEVCINNLNDIQLAIVLIRLYDSDSAMPSNLRRLLETEILNSERSDPFSKSMAYWTLGDHLSALNTLLEGDIKNANIFIFHRFLKNQPMLVMQKDKVKEEPTLFFSTAKNYLNSGCPLLALEVLCSEDHLDRNQAQRIKFIACLHILLDELKTLNYDGSGGSDFIETFDEWFECNMEALSNVCSFSGSRESILRTMLTYCGLHFADNEGLTQVRSAVLGKLECYNQIN